jgi:hypothetical protein
MEPQHPIWIPGSLGVVDVSTWRLSQKIKEYDERLVLARNEDNGQWCVFIRMPRGGDWPELMPILGLTQPPHDARDLDDQEVMHRIWNADTARHGTKILDDIVNTNADIRTGYEAKTNEAAAQVAEVAASVLQRAGKAPSTSFPVTRHARKQRWDGG